MYKQSVKQLRSQFVQHKASQRVDQWEARAAVELSRGHVRKRRGGGQAVGMAMGRFTVQREEGGAAKTASNCCRIRSPLGEGCSAPRPNQHHCSQSAALPARPPPALPPISTLHPWSAHVAWPHPLSLVTCLLHPSPRPCLVLLHAPPPPPVGHTHTHTHTHACTRTHARARLHACPPYACSPGRA